MSKMWHKNLNKELREALEKELNEISRYKEVYNKADNKAIAQLWTAIANLSKKISELNPKKSKRGNAKSTEKILKKF